MSLQRGWLWYYVGRKLKLSGISEYFTGERIFFLASLLVLCLGTDQKLLFPSDSSVIPFLLFSLYFFLCLLFLHLLIISLLHPTPTIQFLEHVCESGSISRVLQLLFSRILMTLWCKNKPKCPLGMFRPQGVVGTMANLSFVKKAAATHLPLNGQVGSSDFSKKGQKCKSLCEISWFLNARN